MMMCKSGDMQGIIKHHYGFLVKAFYSNIGQTDFFGVALLVVLK